jgi:methylenetetrahydrofolate reductase (NADPH)
MKITDLWSQSERPTLSFELFPPKTDKAAQRLDKAIHELAALEPAFVSVTFGAGGSTREGSYQLLEKLMAEHGMETLGYFAGYGLGPDEITSTLDSYQQLGIENILIVRGDVPLEDEEFTPHPDTFQHANQLLEFVRPKYNFCIGVAAYPEGHIEADSLDKDMGYLKQKADSGAEFIITNYAYDNRYFFNFVARARRAGIDQPILPGVMPIYTEKMTNFLAKLCGATITPEIKESLSGIAEDDKSAVLQFGIDYAYQQCKGLLDAGVPGVHIYTMDRSKSVVEIISRLREEGYTI